MAQSETTNAHLHKVLTHRNYMHHVALQKQLNIYDRQKKLVERELLQITKVREAIQQINKSLPKKSQRFKKRGSTANNLTKKSKYDSSFVMKSGKTVKDREEGLREHGVVDDGIENGEDGPINVNEEKLFGPKDENIAHSSIQSFPVQRKGDYATRGVLPKEELREASSSNAISESNIEPVTQRISRTIDSKSNTVPVNNQIPGKLPVSPSESGHPSNINDGKMTTEKYVKKTTSQLTPSTGNEKLFTRRRPPYMKSCSAPSLPVQKLEEAVESEANMNERCEIYRLPETPTGMVNKDRYANSDEDLYRKSLLANHANAGTKLPKLINIGGPDGNANKTIDASNLVNNVQCLEAGKNNSSPTFGAFPNSDVCSLVQRSRPRSKTVSDLETPKPKAAWNSPGRQRRHKESPHFPNTFSNNDVCIIDRLRTRATTVSNLDNSFPEYSRSRSKTESCNILPGSQQRSARDSNCFLENPRPRSITVTGTNENWTKAGVKSAPGMEYCRNKSHSCEPVRLSEDEYIAIKGKFRQIGHSVLAIALMKKMTKKQ